MKKYILIIFSFIFSSALRSQVPPPPPLNFNERWTNLWSVSYDYQSSGSVKYIVEDPTTSSNLCAIMMGQQDSNTAPGVQRYVYFAYSDDAGITWSTSPVTTNVSLGFPSLTLSNGIPVISAQQSGTVGMRVWKDVVFGGFSLDELTGIPPISGSNQPVSAIITGTTNGSLVMLASTPDTATKKSYYNRYQGTWSNWQVLQNKSVPSENYTIAAGTNGVVGLFGTNYAGKRLLYYHKSTNNGVTFDNGTWIFSHYIDGQDTLYADPVGGMQAVYSADNNPHLVFTVYSQKNYSFPNPYTKAFGASKILHWSPATGITEVANRQRIPTLADTITNSLVAPLCQPSISRKNDGRLICSFTTFLRGNTQTVDNGDVLNAGEIFYSSSGNNGSSWSFNSNVTNTPNMEEKNSSIPFTNTNNIRLCFLRDMKAGSWVVNPAWGKAPVYGIFREFIIFQSDETETVSNTLGLSQNYPNPFNPKTVIRYSLFENRFTTLVVYNALGKEVVRLVNETLTPGDYETVFDSTDLPSGMYFYKLTSGNFSKVNKMMLIR